MRVLAVCLISAWAAFTAFADISVKIERHFPCSASTGPNKDSLLIRFPSYKSTGVNFKEEPLAGHKCFRMSGGKVEVFPPGLSGDKRYYVHLETRIGIHGKPERCVNADADGCGGIGSCVHCDICRTMGGNLRNFVQIYQRDQPAKCSVEGLLPGDYDDLSLKICLPTKNELLPFLDQNQSRAEQLWDLFVSSRARSGEIPLVIAARLFDRPINKLSIKELNDALHGRKQGMIGCHWIYATVSQN
ncbi:Protein C34E7.4 [Aphelenchoides avenae]|nr:Protein C34E7.4 [Aphelenchus avenae]